MKTSEQQFEEWAEGKPQLSVSSAWAAWKASREMLCVELPEYLDRERIGFAAYDAIEVENLLDDAGVKFK